MSEAIARRVLTAQLTVDKHSEMDLANATFKSLAVLRLQYDAAGRLHSSSYSCMQQQNAGGPVGGEQM